MRERTVDTDLSLQTLVAHELNMTVDAYLEWRAAWQPPAPKLHEMTAKGALEVFLASLMQDGAPDETLRTYRTELSYFLEYATQGHLDGPLHEISPADIERWLSLPPRRRYGRPSSGQSRLSPASRNKKLALLRRFFAYACAPEQKWIGQDPVVHMKRQRSTAHAPRAMARREYRCLLHAAAKGRHRERDVLMLRLMAESGLRIGTLVQLRVSDLQPDLGRGAGLLVLRRDKGGKSGLAFVPPQLVRDLRAYIAHAGLAWQPEAFLFHRPQDPSRPLTSRTAWGVFREALRNAGLADLAYHPSPHSLRHMFGYEMKELGLPLDDIQQLMNHQWLGTTMVYTRTPTAALRRKLAERLRRARRRVR